jgi:hypothetical protein
LPVQVGVKYWFGCEYTKPIQSHSINQNFVSIDLQVSDFIMWNVFFSCEIMDDMHGKFVLNECDTKSKKVKDISAKPVDFCDTFSHTSSCLYGMLQIV